MGISHNILRVLKNSVSFFGLCTIQSILVLCISPKHACIGKEFAGMISYVHVRTKKPRVGIGTQSYITKTKNNCACESFCTDLDLSVLVLGLWWGILMKQCSRLNIFPAIRGRKC